MSAPFFARVDTPESLVSAIRVQLVTMGVELAEEQVQSLVAYVLASYIKEVSADREDSEWSPGDRWPDPEHGGIVVRVERRLQVEDAVCVVLDGDDAVTVFPEVDANPTPTAEEITSANGWPGIVPAPFDSEKRDKQDFGNEIYEALYDFEPDIPGLVRATQLRSPTEVIVRASELPTPVLQAMSPRGLKTIIEVALGAPVHLSTEQLNAALNLIRPPLDFQK